MGELCEIHAQRLMTLLICGQWRFVALRDEAVIAASPASMLDVGSGGGLDTDRLAAAIAAAIRGALGGARRPPPNVHLHGDIYGVSDLEQAVARGVTQAMVATSR